MKVLVIGNGGREHALCWKLKQSPKVTKVFCAPGNAGTALEGENVDIKATDAARLVKFAVAEKIGLAVVGPEAALVAGSGRRRVGNTVARMLHPRLVGHCRMGRIADDGPNQAVPPET